MAVVTYKGRAMLHGEINRYWLNDLVAVCWCDRQQSGRFWLKRSMAKFLRSIGWARFGESGWYCPFCERRKAIQFRWEKPPYAG